MGNDEAQDKANEVTPSQEHEKYRILKAGETFGHYRVVRCISAGLLANYYHMQHVRDLHDVTVVILHPKTSGDGEFFKRMKKLKARVAKLNHESFPKIQECVVVKGQYCLFMDHIEGVHLSDYLTKNGQPGKSGLGPEKTMRILAQLHSALGCAHAKGLDHRDLNSDLIFIDDEEQLHIFGLGFKAVFGVDLFEAIVSVSVSPLASNQTIGRLSSFDVLSPEYRQGVIEDYRVDIYGAGVVGYWLLTGIKPDTGNPKLAAELVDFLPEAWDEFFKHSFNKGAEKRYRSCNLALLGLKDADEKEDSENDHFIQRQIDKIPVPRGVRDRGKGATRTFRLLLIGIVGVTLVGLAASFMKATFIEEVDFKEVVAVRAKEGKKPALALRINPVRARVAIVGAQDRFTVIDGKLDLLIRPGKHELRVSAPEHISQNFAVDITADGFVEQVVELKPAWAYLEIKAAPNSNVYEVDPDNVETKVGETDSDGRFSYKLGVEQDEYSLVVKKTGFGSYVVQNSEFSFGEVAIITADMVFMPSSIDVVAIPEGAAISIDGVEVGRTPLKNYGVGADALHAVSIELDGYRSISREIELEAGAEEILDFGELVPRSGELNFEIAFEGVDATESVPLLEEITVMVDAEKYSLGSDALKLIPEGVRNVEIIHPAYDFKPLDVNVSDQAVETISALLQLKSGYIELTMPEALSPQVYVNGALALLEEGRVEVPPNDVVDVELRIRDHLTMRRRLELEPAEVLQWDVAPTRIPAPTSGKAWFVPYVGISFQWLPAGSYEMGSPLKEHARIPNEGPATEVSHSRGFWAGTYEVTRQQYSSIIELDSPLRNDLEKPIDSVTWSEAKAFCEKLNEIEALAGRLPEGYVYRLPTEAEWEYAARGGTVDPFFWGEQADVTNGNFKGVYPIGRKDGQFSSDVYGTSVVGAYAPNPFGLYDTQGNVSEWTLDRYNGRLKGGSLSDPLPYSDGSQITLRGGSWEDNAKRVRSAARDSASPETESNSIGFRLFLAPEL